MGFGKITQPIHLINYHFRPAAHPLRVILKYPGLASFPSRDSYVSRSPQDPKLPSDSRHP
uniref:Uncharacterized protein n=1 Tax=Pristionchus pacificus TaxID=54126 RepID=A0A2A6CHK7_PRIPA|eukprot:PDM77558.1 hypothetical protein PRIPAC_34425 [Pristionchus pacificus]